MDSIKVNDEDLIELAHHIARLKNVWTLMRRRCVDVDDHAYKHYGARGILITPEWDDFGVFVVWAIRNGFDSSLELDREDNDGPYAPSNCRWITHAENCNNKSNNRRVTAFGETKTVSQWAQDERCVVPDRLLRYRLAVGGWPSEEAITTIPGRRSKPDPEHCPNGHLFRENRRHHDGGKSGHPYDYCLLCKREAAREHERTRVRDRSKK
jgi:hypothetical protein